MLMRFLFGDDIFISYSRRDGAKYAAALANELSKPGNDFSCFLDQWGASAANKLSNPVLRAVDRSSVLVLIGTAGAAGSQLVQQEVKLFSRKKWLRSLRPVLPINIDGALNTVSWTELTGLHRVPETDEARSDGVPSQAVIKLIADSYSYTKRAQRTRWLSIVALVLLISSVLIGSLAAYQARRANAEARRANAESQRANQEAQAAREQAEEARNSKARADAEAEKAQKSAAEAKRQQGIADEKAREAEHQAKVATENARTAKSQELSAHAKTISSLDPRAAVIAALDAVRVKTTAEAEDALRTSLLKFPEQRILSGHREFILSTDFSPDDRLVVTTSVDGIARIWNVETGELVKSIKDDQTPILSAAISPDGKHLVLSGRTTRMPGFAVGKRAKTDDPETDDPGFIQIRDLPSGEIRQTFREMSGLNISFSRDGRFAVLSPRDLSISNMSIYFGSRPVVLDLNAGETIELPEDLTIGDAVFTPENKILIAGTFESEKQQVKIEVIDLKTSTATSRIIEAFGPSELFTASNGDRTMLLAGGNVALLNSTGEIVTSIKGDFICAAFSKNGQLFATGDKEGRVKIYTAATGDLLASGERNPNSVSSMSFTADDQHLVVSGDDNVLRVLRIRPADERSAFVTPTTVSPAALEEVAELTGHAAPITNVKTSHSGNLILTAGTDGTARLWDLKTIYSPNTSLATIDGRSSYWEAAISPLGDRVVTVGRFTHLWDTKTGAHLAVLAKDPSAKRERGVDSMGAVFSRTGKLIIIARETNDQSLAEVYDASGVFLARLPGKVNTATGAAVTPDDKFVAFAGGNDGLIWSTAENRVVKRLIGHAGEVASIAFSPNAKRLVTVGKDRSARLWSFPDGRALDKVQINSEEFYDAAFSPNGRYVLIICGLHAQLWDTIAHKTTRLAEHEQVIIKWGFSNDSTLLFTRDMSGKTLIHKTSDGGIQTSLSTGVMAFTGNDKFLIDATLWVWDAKSGRLFSSPVGPAFIVKALNLTEDNQLTAITDDGSIVHRALDETSSLNTLLSIAEKRTRKPPAQNQRSPH